jgi:arylsulfatase A-like enzyme
MHRSDSYVRHKYRAPQVVRWPGHIKPGTVKNQLFAALDWLPTFVDIAGGPKGDGLKNQIQAGQYPGIVKTTLDGFDQREYLEGTSARSARDYFFYYSGSTPSAVRYKNWKMYYTMSQPGPAGWIMPFAHSRRIGLGRRQGRKRLLRFRVGRHVCKLLHRPRGRQGGNEDCGAPVAADLSLGG